MLRFIHTADWQLGAPNLLPACQRPLEALIESARAEKATFIVCAGDVFHRPSPDQQTKDYLLQTILNTPDMFFVFMAGNHDYTNKERDYTSLKYISLLTRFKKITNTYVIEPGRYITFKSAVFWALDEWDDIKTVQAPKDKGKPTIALWHGIIPGLNIKNLGYDQEKEKEHDRFLAKAGVAYVALGDIHKQFKVHERCYYSGALTQTSYVDDLGALAVCVDGDAIEIEPLKLDLPKKISIAVDYKEGTHTEEDIITCVKNNVNSSNLVKVKFNLPLELYSAVNKTYIEEQLKKYCVSITFDNDPITTQRSRKGMDKMTKATTFEQEVDIVLAEEDFDLDKKVLKKRILEIMEHAEIE